jgi:hypothetical protein
MQEVTYDVVVNKAGLPLAKGESLGEYTAALHTASRKFASQKLNLDVKKADVYTTEIFASAVIFSVYKYSTETEPSEHRYYAAKCARDADGAFAFSDMQEVVRVTRFEAKPSLPISKAAPKPTKKCGCGKASSEAMDCTMKSCSQKAVSKAVEGPVAARKADRNEVAPGWVLSEKAFWHGVI